VSKIDENVRPMAATGQREVKGRVCNDRRVSEHAISSSGHNSHDHFLSRYLPLLPRYFSPPWRTLTLGMCAVQRVRLSLDGDRCGATHLLERKEKKKKDKIADVSDHAEIQPQIVRGARKKRKTEDPETPVRAGPISSNPEGEGRKKRKRDREGEEPLPEDKKKKKHKKEKTSGAANDPATDPPLGVPDTSGVVRIAAVVPKITEEKKQKKKKSSDYPASSVTEPTPSVGAADTSGKSRKRKPTNGDAVDANGDKGSLQKPRSKSKKRKEETVEDEGQRSTPVPTEDRSSQKRKKAKASIHPDPSDDSDLTEQSQKG